MSIHWPGLLLQAVSDILVGIEKVTLERPLSQLEGETVLM
jgi:hypothetical protein